MLSQQHHTGHLLPHHHTSYAGLTFVLMLTAIFIAAFSVPSRADSLISARVNGPAPSQGATIYDPANNQVFNEAQILVSGHCPDGTYVKLLRNNVLAGSTFCQPSNSFNLQITLVQGSNFLLAQDYDSIDQPGPVTAGITVTYQAKAPDTNTTTPSYPAHSTTLPAATAPKIIALPTLLITADTPLTKDLTPGKMHTWHITVSGGEKPYALKWDWGDETTNIYSLPESGNFTPNHAYKRSGRYIIRIEASDAGNNRAILQLAALVNGPAAPAGSGIRSDGRLLIAWPLWLVAALMILSFWLGDKYKKLHPHSGTTPQGA